jgi:hypothetical protein
LGIGKSTASYRKTKTIARRTRREIGYPEEQVQGRLQASIPSQRLVGLVAQAHVEEDFPNFRHGYFSNGDHGPTAM